MLIKPLTGLVFASAAGLCMTLGAEASPRFTVENTLKTDVEIYIFAGNDTYCGSHEKYKKLPAGKTRTYGCSGHGKGKCKIKLEVHTETVCRSDRNTCSKSAIKMEDGSTISVKKKSKNKFYCELE